MSIVSVASERATNATGGLWTSRTANGLDEVPPDGIVSIAFSSPVLVGAVLEALTLAPSLPLLRPHPKAPEPQFVECSQRPDAEPLHAWVSDWPTFRRSLSDSSRSLPAEPRTQVCVTFSDGGLAYGVNYTLQLPAGTRYNPDAGALATTAAVQLAGLQPFTIPFMPDQSLYTPNPALDSWAGVSFRRLRMAMPHGISRTTTAGDFKRQLALHAVPPSGGGGSEEAVDFDVTLDRATATVQLTARLLPESQYRLWVVPTELRQPLSSGGVFSADTFGQPLDTPTHAPHETRFSTTPLAPLFSPVTTSSRSSSVDLRSNLGAGLQWPVILRGNASANGVASLVGLPVGADLAAATLPPVAAPDYIALEDVLDQVYGYSAAAPSPRADVAFRGGAAITSAMHTADTVELQAINVTELLQPSGLAYLHQTQGGYDVASSLLMTSDVGVGLVSNGSVCTAWAVDVATGQPVAGVHFRMRRVRQFGKTPSSWVAGEATTGGDGLATLALTGGGAGSDEAAFVAVLTTPDQKTVVRDISVYPNPDSSASGPAYGCSFVVDKTVVAPGQTLYVKGYVRSVSQGPPALPPAFPPVSVAVGPWDGAQGAPATVPVAVDPEFGTFELRLPVPAAAALSTTVTVAAQACIERSAVQQARLPLPGPTEADSGCPGGWTQLQSISIAVADPRPPTAEVSMEAPQWVRPGANVTVHVTATSLIGATVAGSNISISWTLSRDWTPAVVSGTPLKTASGVVHVTTDAAGRAAAVVPAASTTRDGFDQGTLALELDWVGPTRELVTATASVSIWPSRVAVTLAPSTFTDVPLQEFAILTTVVDRVDDRAIAARTVTVSVVALSQRECDMLPFCGASRPKGSSFLFTHQPPSNAEVVCRVHTTSEGTVPWDQCRYTLRDVGIHLFTACTTAAGAGAPETVCQAMFMGLSLLEWSKEQLAAFPAPSVQWMLEGGASGFVPGTTAVMWLENPAPNASAVISWSSTSASGSVVLAGVDAGLQVLDFVVHPSCSGGCAIVVGLFWPRGAFEAPPRVPVNPLFDPALPCIQFVNAPTLPVAPPGDGPSLSMALSVAGDAAAGAHGGTGAQTAVVAPGSSATIAIELQTCLGTDADANCTGIDAAAEVTVIVVDKSWLLLSSYPQPAPQDAFQSSALPSLSVADTLAGSVSTGAVAYLKETALRRLAIDPWTSPSLDLSDFYSAQQNDAQFFASNTFSLTASGAFPVFLGAAADSVASLAAASPPAFAVRPASVTSDRTPGNESPPTSGMAVRKAVNFEATPLVRVLRLPGGGGGGRSLEFTAPQNLGTFEVRAYAASARGDLFATAATEVVVRRAISLTAAVPRVVRLHDAFLCGVVVTLAAAASAARPVSVEVSLSLSGGVALQPGVAGASVITFSGSSSTQEVRFALTATAMGAAALTFAASDGAGARDALALSLSVEGLQGPVSIASSFSVQASEAPFRGAASLWQEGLALPEAAPGSGTLQLLAGVGKLPAVQALVAQLLASGPPDASAVTAPWALAALLSRPTLYAYSSAGLDGPTPALPWMNATASAPLSAATGSNITLDAATRAALAVAVEALKDQLTLDASVGLMYFPKHAWPRWQPPTSCDVDLNLRAIWTIDRLRAFSSGWDVPVRPHSTSSAGDAPPPFGHSALGTVQALAGTLWLPAAKAQLISEAVESRLASSPSPYFSVDNIVLLRDRVGLDWDPRDDVAAAYQRAAAASGDSNATRAALVVATVVADLGMPRVYASLPEMSAQGAAFLALALVYRAVTSETARTALVATCQKLVNLVRVTGRTAYFADAAGSPFPADTSTQALALLALTEYGTTLSAPAPFAALAAKVAAYLASSPATPGLYCVASATAVGDSMLSLARFDAHANNTHPHLTLTVRSAPVTLMRADFATPEASPAHTSTPWGALATPPAPLQFVARGSGQVTVTALGTFVPATLLRFPLYRGIQVSLTVRRTANANIVTGRPLTVVGLGDVVQVAVQVLTPDALGRSAVRVMLPGGLEALDPMLNSQVAVPCALPWFFGASAGDPAPIGWFPPCPRQTTAPSVVTFAVDSLAAGVQEFSFSAVATTTGNWTFPPASAYAVDQPEVMGMAVGGELIVCSGTPCSAAYLALDAPAAPLAVPKGCPNGCSRAGACDTTVGRCLCDSGFAGADCSSFAR